MFLDITFIVLLFLGIFGTAIPTLPGTAYMFLVVLIYGFVDQFEHIEPWHLAIFGAMVILSTVIDYSSGLIGAKFGGASKSSLVFGLCGLVIGLIALPPFGLFLGLFLGVFIGELTQMKHHTQAFKAASYSFLGVVGGTILNVILAMVFFTIFLIIRY